MTSPAALMLLQAKMQGLAYAPSGAATNLTAHQPADAPSFQVNSQPFPVYPAPGAGTTTLLSYTVPQGLIAVLKFIAIVAVGGGFIDGSGNIIWRCWINGNPVDGLDTITAELGSFIIPNPIQLVLNENDVFYITVEVPAAQPPMPPGATSGARIQGWTYPVGKESQ